MIRMLPGSGHRKRIRNDFDISDVFKTSAVMPKLREHSLFY